MQGACRATAEQVIICVILLPDFGNFCRLSPLDADNFTKRQFCAPSLNKDAADVSKEARRGINLPAGDA